MDKSALFGSRTARRSTSSVGRFLDPNSPLIRSAGQSDYVRIIQINDAEILQTSAMDLPRLESLAAMACYHKVYVVEDCIAAFLIALRDDAPYDNDNYKWFSSRLNNFVYVDRIVVAAEFAGIRIGSLLYEDLFSYARLHGVTNVTCEYNIVPPNPASAAFHRKFGFKELGRQWVANRTKWVSLQAAAA